MRLFIAINPDEKVKDKIEAIVKKLKKIRQLNQLKKFRFLPKENWHLTITFLGEQKEKENIVLAIKKTVKRWSTSFEITFDKIVFSNNRMIWLKTDEQTSKKLKEFKKNLDQELKNQGTKFRIENRDFCGHLTLARFLYEKNQKLISECERKAIEISASYLPISFGLESIELMESKLFFNGARYFTLDKFDFFKDKI